MRNVTLSFDEELIEKGKAYASRHRMSFNALIRESVRRMISSESAKSANRLIEALDYADGHSADRTWTRDEIHER